MGLSGWLLPAVAENMQMHKGTRSPVGISPGVGALLPSRPTASPVLVKLKEPGQVPPPNRGRLLWPPSTFTELAFLSRVLSPWQVWPLDYSVFTECFQSLPLSVPL